MSSNAGSLGDLQRAFQDYLLASGDSFQTAVRDTSKADRITLLDVYRAVEAGEELFSLHPSEPSRSCNVGGNIRDVLRPIFCTAHRAVESVLGGVTIADVGEQVMAMARAEAPALILMDMSLPGLDGWEATRQIKAAPETRGIPVIALTAHAMSGDREKAIAAGCDEFDTKPVELRAAVRAGDAVSETWSYALPPG